MDITDQREYDEKYAQVCDAVWRIFYDESYADLLGDQPTHTSSECRKAANAVFDVIVTPPG